MATTASGFWYPDEGTSFNINTIMSTMASSLQTKVGPHVIDTGWVPIPLMSGITGTLTHRRVGKIVQVIASGIGRPGSFGARSATQVAGDNSVPTGNRPLFNIRGSGNGSGSTNTILSVLNNGSVYVFNQDTSATASMDGTTMYLVD